MINVHRRITYSGAKYTNTVGCSCFNVSATKTIVLVTFLLVTSNLSLTHSRYTYYPHGDYDDDYGYSQQAYHLDENNKNRIESEEQCKNYLCKYGYLNCNCTSYLLPISSGGRQKRSLAPPEVIPTELDVSNVNQFDQYATFPPILTTPSNQACRAHHFRKGYEQFQAIYRLNVTGHCDAYTKAYMSKSRCGQPDIFDTDEMNDLDSSEVYKHYKTYDSSVSDDSSSADYYYRKSRRVRRDLSENISNDETGSAREEQLQDLIAKQPDNHITYNQGQSTRKKRSTFSFEIADPIGKLNKDVVTWRLMSAHTNPSIPVAVQNAILGQAFRYWSEVAPLCFREDLRSHHVDIEVGFVEGTHLNCYKQFDGLGGEVAHKFYRDVHFDKTDPYTASANPTRPTDISLLLVAVHEIGHVLGLNHSVVQKSVMNAIYHRNIRGRFELTKRDREDIKDLYGKCTGKFDIVMDYVRNSGSSRVFNTYFFRGNNFWIYENKNNRTRYGDPKRITSNHWQGLPSHLDAFVHYFESDRNGRNRVSEHYYFFKGSKYYKFDPDSDMVVKRGSISSMFRPGHNGAVPNNLDSAFFEYNTKMIFFFKGSMVYKYDYKLMGGHSCCAQRPTRIVNLFPPASRTKDLYAPSGITYADGIDSVYLSWSNPYKLYFIKDDEAWYVDGYSIFGRYNEGSFRVRYLGKWNTVWLYICEADC